MTQATPRTGNPARLKVKRRDPLPLLPDGRISVEPLVFRRSARPNQQGVLMSVTPAPPTPTKPYKAIAAFVLTFLGLLIQALDPAAEHHPVTWQEWLVVVVGALVTTGTVYQITNPAKREHL